MDERFFRTVYEIIKPTGAIWTAENGKDLDSFRNALSEAKIDVADFLGQLATIRRPETTTYLDELEQELGVVRDPEATEEERREYLQVLLSRRGSIKNAERLEEILRGVGFDVYVHINNPPVDPDKFLFEAYKTICGNPYAICGNPNAICGGVGGELLVNGDLVVTRPLYQMVCDNPNAVCGNPQTVCGRFEVRRQIIVTYEIPADDGYWGLFFFVGGVATRNPAGELTNIESAEVPYSRRDEFIKLILDYKPLHSWAGLITIYV